MGRIRSHCIVKWTACRYLSQVIISNVSQSVNIGKEFWEDFSNIISISCLRQFYSYNQYTHIYCKDSLMRSNKSAHLFLKSESAVLLNRRKSKLIFITPTWEEKRRKCSPRLVHTYVVFLYTNVTERQYNIHCTMVNFMEEQQIITNISLIWSQHHFSK